MSTFNRRWSGVLARLGYPTGDRRIIAPGGGSSRGLPLPLMYQNATDDGHGGAVVVGTIDTLSIGDGMVTATGRMLDAAYGTDVMELLEAGVVGPSVDLDDIEYVMDDQENLVITRWRIAGATLVAIPAFEGVSVTLDPMPAEPHDEDDEDRPSHDMDSLWASAGPAALPTAGWFKDPGLTELTPLTVTPEGRVFGHIAGWGSCHIGLPGCVTPPTSWAEYRYFHVADQPVAEGFTLPVGTLVAGPRHADAQLAFQAAQQHYDDPAAAVARVVAGEDEHGIWVAGWMLPGAVDEAVDIFRTSPVSGDWRRVGGHLELIAVCSVNAPGFPVPRARVAFSAGAQQTLVGAFGITPVAGVPNDSFVRTTDASGRARWAWATTGMEG